MSISIMWGAKVFRILNLNILWNASSVQASNKMSPQIKLVTLLKSTVFMHREFLIWTICIYQIFLKIQDILSWKICICLCKFHPLNLTALKDGCSLLYSFEMVCIQWCYSKIVSINVYMYLVSGYLNLFVEQSWN